LHGGECLQHFAVASLAFLTGPLLGLGSLNELAMRLLRLRDLLAKALGGRRETCQFGREFSAGRRFLCSHLRERDFVARGENCGVTAGRASAAPADEQADHGANDEAEHETDE
jgi:hypothetical protein